MKTKIKGNIISFIFATFFMSTTLTADPVYYVTIGDNEGPGSLRNALEDSVVENSPVIVIDTSVSIITIDHTLIYGGKAPLMIVGSGQTINGGDMEETLFEVTDGADLTMSNLTFTVNSDYNIDNQGGGKGILLTVPFDREGVVNLSLNNVEVSNVGQHGIYVSDCDAVICGAGSGGVGEGSSASVHAHLTNVKVMNVGNGSFDSDGLRIDERGAGDIVFNATGSLFNGVGADGVELDEGGDGDVIVHVQNSAFNDNGAYCSPIDLNEYNNSEPAPENADYLACLEYDVKKGKYELDLDDGFDIDEAGQGSIRGKINNVWVMNNQDEGLDFDEEGKGGIDIQLVKITSISNFDEGIKISEQHQGDVVVALTAVTAIDNNDEGVQLEQDHAGDIYVTVNGSKLINNKKKGLKVSQDGSGIRSVKVRGSQIDDESNIEESRLFISKEALH